MSISDYATTVELINLPVLVRVNFLKYFFINTGIFFEIDLSNTNVIDEQTGIGAIAGVGLNYESQLGISVFANPYLKAHSLLPFTPEDYPQRIMESGIRFGAIYTLKSEQNLENEID